MSNLYASIECLHQFSVTDGLPELQRQFILNIINGDDTRASLNEIVGFRKKEQLIDLKLIVGQMIRDTPYISWPELRFNFSYIRLLKSVFNDINAMQKAEETIASYSQKKPIRYKKMVQIIDTLYSATKDKYQGTIMLPVMQGIDARLGNSGGECFGYIAEWAAQIQQQKNPFGVPVDSVPPFELIKVNSPAWRKYPDLNHLAVLTPNISKYQQLQSKVSELIKELSNQLINKNQHIKYEGSVIDGYTFYSSVNEIAEALVQHVDENPEKTCDLAVRGYGAAHALGFCKINNKYHYMDSNFGWVRFENANEFKQWLPFCFEQLGYNKFFAEYRINNYSLVSEPIPPKVEMGALANTVIYILFAFIAPFLFTWLLTRFLIRTVVYAFLELKNSVDFLKNIFFPPKEEPVVAEIDSAHNFLERHVPKSLEPLDLAINSQRAVVTNKTEVASSRKIRNMLEMSAKDLVKVQERAANNEEFKMHQMKPLFDKPKEGTELHSLSVLKM